MDTTAKQQEDCVRTIMMMEYGLLDLNNIFDYGILLFGKTKAGKTTSSHYLTHQILYGAQNDQGYVTYKLKESDQKVKQAKIGQIENKSETWIPNIFEIPNAQKNYKIPADKKMYLLDCPGYLDTFGFYRIISNRFFHYQVFSKVQNVKFLIVFTYEDMRKSADNVKNTFKEFLGGFSNLQDENVKKKIFEATSVMVTGVQKNVTVQDVKKKYTGTATNIGDELSSYYTELRDQIVKNQRLYIFPKAELDKTCDIKNDILQQISTKSKFWQRKMDRQKQVSMQNVSLSLVKYIKDCQKQFEKQSKIFEQFYQAQVVRKSFQQIKQVFGLLVSDSQNSQQSCQFLLKIISNVTQKNNLKKKYLQFQWMKQLEQRYKPKRQNMQKQLFTSKDGKDSKDGSISTSQASSIKDLPFWLNRIRTLRKIEKHAFSLQTLRQQNKQDEMLVFISNILPNISNALINLSKCKKLPPQKQKDKLKTVTDFFYEVWRNVEVSNKMNKMCKQSTTKPKEQNSIEQLQPKPPTKQKTKELSDFVGQSMMFLIIRYPTVIRQVFLSYTNKTSLEVVQIMIGKIKIEQNLSVKCYEEITTFLEQIRTQAQQSEVMNPIVKTNVLKKLDNLIAKQTNKIFESIKKQQNPKIAIIQKMDNYRKRLLQQIKKCLTQQSYSNEKLTIQYNKVILLMGEVFLKNSRFAIAKDLFDFLFDGHKVIKVLQLQQETQKGKKKSQKQILQHLITFMQAAFKYTRYQLALQKAQQAYHLAILLSDTKSVSYISNFIRNICQESSKKSTLNDYSSYLFKQISAQDLPNQLKAAIKKIIG